MTGEPSANVVEDNGDDRPYSDAELISLGSRLDDLSADAREPSDLLRKLTAPKDEDTSDGAEVSDSLIGACGRALAYSFVDHETKYGAIDLGQRFSSPGGDWPPAFDVIDPREKTFWAELADQTTHPLPKTHLADLALTVGVWKGRDVAEAMVSSYVQLGGTATLDSYYRASCLRRAWTLARQFSMPVELDIRRALYTMAQSVIALPKVPPGILLQPVEPLAVAPRTGSFIDPDKSDVTALLDTIRSKHHHSATVFEAIHRAREQLADTDEERNEARRALIQGYLDLADTFEGLLRQSWLQTAAGEAQRLGLTDMRDAAVTAIQEIPLDDLELTVNDIDIPIHRHALDGRLSQYRRSRNALNALEIWLATPAPTGSYEENLKHASEQSRNSILQTVSSTTLSPEGMPLRSRVGPEDAAQELLETLERLSAGTHGLILARELAAIGAEYGITQGGEIGIHLATKFRCDHQKAEAFGDAIQSYWEGRYADAARAAYPLVEASARGLLLTLGEPLFRIETGNAEGRFPSLETYADKLEAHGLDVDWLRTIRNPVAGLRNSLAHGHHLRPTETDAAILLRMAGMLVVLTPPDSSRADRDAIKQQLRDPLAFVADHARLRRRWRRVWTTGRRHQGK